MKIVCTKCKVEKFKKDFGPGTNNGEVASWCRQCKKEYQNAYAKLRRATPEGKAAHVKSSRISRMAYYGLGPEDYDEIFQLQGGVCAGCGRAPNPDRHLDIDHKHQPGEKKLEGWERASMVRGLLCHLCNRVLGILRDNPQTFKNLAAYLESPPAVPVVLPKFQRALEYLEKFEARRPQ